MAPEHPRFSLEVERYLLGQLSPERVRALRAALGDEALRELERKHRADGEAMLEQASPEAFAHMVRTRAALARTPARRRFEAWLVPAFTAAVALAVVGHGRMGQQAEQEQSELGERPKGLLPTLLVFKREAQGAAQLSEGAEAAAHDVLQLGYLAAGRPYGVIVSLDGAGAVTVHGPARSSGNVQLSPQGKHMLDTAYELDDAPGFERFVLVTSAKPFDLSVVVNAARTIAGGPGAMRERLPLPTELEQVSFVVHKARP